MKKSLFFALVITPWIVLAEHQQTLLDSCKKKEENLRELENAPSHQVSPHCREQIKMSTRTCVNAPEENDEEKKLMAALTTSEGARAAAQNQKMAYDLGRQRFRGHSEVCKNAMREVQKVCGADIEHLKKNLHAVSDHHNDPVQERERHQYRLALQQNLNHIQNYQSKAHKAMRDGHDCSVSYAVIYDDAYTKTASVEDAMSFKVSGDDRHPAVDHATYLSSSDATPAPTYREKAEAVFHKVEHVAENAAHRFKEPGALMAASKVVGTTLKPIGNGFAKGVSGAIGPGYHNAQNDGSGVASTASYLATMAKPQHALKVTGVGTFLSAFLNSDPAGKCSEVYVDPVRAYSQGCSVSTPRGATANEYAIASLDVP